MLNKWQMTMMVKAINKGRGSGGEKKDEKLANLEPAPSQDTIRGVALSMLPGLISSTGAILNPGCPLEFPGELLKFLMLKPHSRPQYVTLGKGSINTRRP